MERKTCYPPPGANAPEPCYPGPEPCDTMCSRETAVTRLRRVAKGYRDKAHALEKLADEIGHLSPDADEALWEMVGRIR